MKKQYLAMLLIVAAVAAFWGCSKGYEVKKTSGDVNIALSVGAYPLIKGDNTLVVKVTDSAGKPVTDGQVKVRFYMPPMPGMAPMELLVQATAKGSDFVAPVNVAMEGGWKADVTVTRQGKPDAAATFNLDAR